MRHIVSHERTCGDRQGYCAGGLGEGACDLIRQDLVYAEYVLGQFSQFCREHLLGTSLVGFGLKVCVDRGHLILEDGISDDRRAGRLPRVHHGLRRIVLIGADGMVSLAALQWLADQNIAFVMLDRDGSVLLSTGPAAASDTRLRRAQACAQHSPAAVDIVRELITLKISGQERVARDKLTNPAAADVISSIRQQLDTAESIDSLRMLEGHAAAVYWTAWKAVPVRVPKR